MSKTFLSIASAALATSVLLAQEPPARQPGTQQPPTTQEPRDRTMPDTGTKTQQAATNADSVLVTWLIVDNENAVALARIAQQRAQSPEVKQFAQRMIDDHNQILQKLHQCRPTNGNGSRLGTGTGPGTGTGTGVGRDPKGEYPGTRETMPRDASGVLSSGPLDHEKLVRDLGRKCLESHTRLLQEKQGAEFDRCFMGMQVGAHIKAVDTLEVFQSYASPALRPTLEEGLRTVQMHLQDAKDLAKRTDTAAAAATTGR